MAPRLTVVIGSVRPGRSGLPVAQWFVEHARALGDDFEITLIDLAELNLPFLDEPNHPRLRQYVHQHTKDWSAQVDASDAFVFVTPEYNHGYSPVLKNAIDFLHQEWAYKPLGFVSYGGIAGGTRAVQQLKQVAISVKLFPIIESVNIPFHAKLLNDDGTIEANEHMVHSADAMLSELAKLQAALQPLRIS